MFCAGPVENGEAGIGMMRFAETRAVENSVDNVDNQLKSFFISNVM